MTSPAKKNTVAREFLQKLVLWPALLATVLAFFLVRSVGACLDDLPPLVDAAPLEDAISACGDGVVATNQNGTDAGESCDPGDASTYPGCTDCRLSCPDGVLDDAGNHCFFSVGTAPSFQAAQQACEIRKGHIVTIASAREAERAEGSGTVDLSIGYWLGISENPSAGGFAPPDPTEPGFPQSLPPCRGCFAFGALDGGDFARLDDASTASAGCLIARNDGVRRWFRVPCFNNEPAFSVLCEREPPGRRIIDCAGNFQCTTIFSTEGNKRYLISRGQALTADEAKSNCAGFPNGRLVVLKTREEREDLAREIAKLQITDPTEATTLWIGLALDEAGAWRWDDGEPEVGAYPIVWGSGQPNGTGAGRAFLRIGKEFDTQLAYSSESADASASASIARGYICERSPP